MILGRDDGDSFGRILECSRGHQVEMVEMRARKLAATGSRKGGDSGLGKDLGAPRWRTVSTSSANVVI